MIYFDNAATTRALPAVAEKMSTMLCEQYGNPASVSAMGLAAGKEIRNCLLYTSPSPRDKRQSRMPSSA